MSVTPKEQLVMAKELVDIFEARGVHIHYGYARAIIRRCPRAVRGRYILASDAWDWWCLHPDFTPFSQRPCEENSGLAVLLALDRAKLLLERTKGGERGDELQKEIDLALDEISRLKHGEDSP